MATDAQLDQQIRDAAMAAGNAAVRAMEASVTQVFAEPPDFSAANEYAAWATRRATPPAS